jgi:hypothetical protein
LRTSFVEEDGEIKLSGDLDCSNDIRLVRNTSAKSCLATCNNHYRSRVRNLHRDINNENDESHQYIECTGKTKQGLRAVMREETLEPAVVDKVIHLEDKDIGTINLSVFVQYLKMLGLCRLLTVTICNID